jgi:hypothetical protein
MTRVRRLSTLAVCAVAFVALSALPAQAKTAPPEKWGATFCGSLSEWSDTVTQSASEIQASVTPGSTPAAGKAIIVGFLGDFVDTTHAFYTTMRKAGTPDTDNGAKIQKEILKGISGIESQVGTMQDLANALPTTDATAFQTSVNALSAAFDTVSTPFDNAMSKVAVLDKDNNLSDSLQKVKSCKALFG